MQPGRRLQLKMQTQTLLCQVKFCRKATALLSYYITPRSVHGTKPDSTHMGVGNVGVVLGKVNMKKSTWIRSKILSKIRAQNFAE